MSRIDVGFSREIKNGQREEKRREEEKGLAYFTLQINTKGKSGMFFSATVGWGQSELIMDSLVTLTTLPLVSLQQATPIPSLICCQIISSLSLLLLLRLNYKGYLWTLPCFFPGVPVILR